MIANVSFARRRGIERLVKKAKQSREESEEAKPSAEARGTGSDNNPKKKKSGGAKQD